MQKTDLILLGLAVAALVATGVGAAASQRLTGEHTVDFATLDTPLVAQPPADAGGAGAAFNWTVPDNATSATLQVAVTFSGQAVQGGSATITVRVKTPDGGFGRDTTVSMAIAAGGTSATVKVDVQADWLEVPSDVRDGRDGKPAQVTWLQPLEVLVVASQPSDLPVADYGFTATATGSVVSYYAK